MKERQLTDHQLLELLDNRSQQPAEMSAADQSRLAELQRVHQALSAPRLEDPSRNFTARVMANLHRAVPVTVLSPRNGLLLLSGVVVALFIVVTMLSGGYFDSFAGQWSGREVALPVRNYNVELPAVNFNGKLFLNILVGVNLVIAFMVLDRTVLRPYFQRRRQLMQS